MGKVSDYYDVYMDVPFIEQNLGQIYEIKEIKPVKLSPRPPQEVTRLCVSFCNTPRKLILSPTMARTLVKWWGDDFDAWKAERVSLSVQVNGQRKLKIIKRHVASGHFNVIK
jgi:hypothetical protein